MRVASTLKKYAGSWVGVMLIASLVGGCDDQSGTSSSQGATSVTQSLAVGSGGSSSTACYYDSPDIPSVGRRTGKCAGGMLTIAGAPGGAVLVGADYSFEPTTSDTNGMSLTFTVKNKPGWATFDPSTGILSGVPTAADVGTYSDIRISATNGLRAVSLPVFSIAVTESATGSVTVSWMPPTTNSDGTPITNLAGYQIIYGPSPSTLAKAVNVNSAGLTTYVIDNLTPGTWYFAIKSINNDGVDSSESPVVAITIAGS